MLQESRETAAAGRPLVSLRRGVFADLALAMVALGLGTGAVFPIAVLALGVPPDVALRLPFVVATLAAGLLVGGINFLTARRVVGRRLRTLASRMTFVADVIRDAAYTGDWSRCSPGDCILPVDSDDEIGESAAAFNRLLHALHSARTVETTLSSFAAATSRHLALDELGSAMVSSVVRYTNGTGGAFVTIGDQMAVYARTRLTDPLLEKTALRAAVAAQRPELVEGDEQSPFVLVVPLRYRESLVGALLVGLAAEPPPNILRLAEVLQDTAAVAVNNALVHREVQSLAAIDTLTGVHNRRSGFARLDEEWSKAVRHATNLAVLMIDLDHFKRINDVHGHQVGDRVLREVGAALRSTVRDHDIVIRAGGEEFVIVLPAAGLEGARVIGERVRRSVAELHVPADPDTVRLTTSVGGAAFPEQRCASVDDLVRLADEALYQAKAAGRDRLVVAPAGAASRDADAAECRAGPPNTT